MAISLTLARITAKITLKIKREGVNHHFNAARKSLAPVLEQKENKTEDNRLEGSRRGEALLTKAEPRPRSESCRNGSLNPARMLQFCVLIELLSAEVTNEMTFIKKRIYKKLGSTKKSLGKEVKQKALIVRGKKIRKHLNLLRPKTDRKIHSYHF